jgi:exopolysaccharide biosynthesis protein
MNLKKIAALLMLIVMALTLTVQAETVLEPLSMDDLSFGAKPKDENYVANPAEKVKGQEYISHTGYEDESISVQIYRDRYADTDYVYAHVKISHPSQLRSAPASMDSEGLKNPSFKQGSKTRGRLIADAVNAVVSLNGDFHIKTEGKATFRMGTQVRNNLDGRYDLLIIDKNGDFSHISGNKDRKNGPLYPLKADYAAYYEANQENMYQVFCFGPVLVENGVSVIDEKYLNKSIGSQNAAQRAAICQLGPLEYMLVASYGNQTKGNKGMTIYEFAQVCEQAGRALNPENGCLLAFNLDGGNSTTLNFKGMRNNMFTYVKVNCPDIERQVSDIIYFATLVK